MEATLKSEWLTALRGGSYKQGKSYLRYKNKFCCLGVLCDILVDDGLGKWEDIEDAKKDALYFTDDFGGSHLKTVYAENGFRWFLGLPDEVQSHLINMNDNGSSFIEIADYIEGEL